MFIRDELSHVESFLNTGNLQKELDESENLKDTIFGLCYAGTTKHSPTKCAAIILFSEYFFRPFSAYIHDQMFDILDGTSQHFVIFAPRGVGKTTSLYIAYAGRKILTRDMKFFVPIADSNTNAVKRADNLKRELITNPIIQKVFGPQETNNFSKDEWTTATGTHVYPRGRGQSIRGSIHGKTRVDCILADDLEDDEMVKNEVRRNDLHDWWLGHVSNTVDRGCDNWRIGMIGTLLHEDCLLVRQSEDPAYESITLSICSDQFVSNWPEFMNDEQIKTLADRFRKANKLDVFYREYMNVAAATEDASFRSEQFQYYNENDQAFLDEQQDIENIVILDPAKTAKMQSADSAIVGIGINLKKRKVYVRAIKKGKMRVHEVVKNTVQMAQQFRIGGCACNIIAIEVVSLNDWIIKPFKDYLSTKGLAFKLVELKGEGATGKIEAKDARIGAMSAYYDMGWMFHNPVTCNPLEQQLLSFPRSKLRDVMDALAYFIYLLEQGKLTFYTDKDDLDKTLNEFDGDGSESGGFDESSMYEEEDLAQLREINALMFNSDGRY